MLIADMPPAPPELQQIQEMHRAQSKESQDLDNAISQLREGALREAAMTLGLQSGAAYRFAEIKTKLESRQNELERIFDFDPLLLEAGRVRPPVLIESSDDLSIAQDGRMMRIAGVTYRIERQVGFVTAAPNWRQYLFRGVVTTPPKHPPRALLPNDKEEREIWREAVAEGWYHGIKHADTVNDKNFNLIRRDYRGMVTYHQLLKEGKVTRPQIVRNDLGVTGDDGELIINDRMLRITVSPEFLPDSKTWNAPNQLEHSYPEQSFRPHYK